MIFVSFLYMILLFQLNFMIGGTILELNLLLFLAQGDRNYTKLSIFDKTSEFFYFNLDCTKLFV